MNINIQKIMDESNLAEIIDDAYLDRGDWRSFVKEFAELIIKECISQVEQAKNSPFVSLDDANRMKHFVDVTKKKIVKHFGIES
jgi:hypothetical protein